MPPHAFPMQSPRGPMQHFTCSMVPGGARTHEDAGGVRGEPSGPVSTRSGSATLITACAWGHRMSVCMQALAKENKKNICKLMTARELATCMVVKVLRRQVAHVSAYVKPCRTLQLGDHQST